MRFYVKNASFDSPSAGLGAREGVMRMSVIPSTPSISLELTPINGQLNIEAMRNLLRVMIVDITTPEDLVVTAEQLQATMPALGPAKKKEDTKLRFRG